jgi:hypothetical protein
VSDGKWVAKTAYNTDFNENYSVFDLPNGIKENGIYSLNIQEAGTKNLTFDMLSSAVSGADFKLRIINNEE